MQDATARVFTLVPRRQAWEVPAGRQMQHVLADLGFHPQAVLVIRGDSLLTPDDAARAGDEIEIRPVISGG